MLLLLMLLKVAGSLPQSNLILPLGMRGITLWKRRDGREEDEGEKRKGGGVYIYYSLLFQCVELDVILFRLRCTSGTFEEEEGEC